GRGVKGLPPIYTEPSGGRSWPRAADRVLVSPTRGGPAVTSIPETIPETMSAVQLVGHGGLDQLVHSHDVPTPRPAAGEVLIDVHACGMNNTDVWVREGAYGSDTDPSEVSSWRRGRSTLTFPRIQGADIVGRIAAVGEGVDPGRVDQRVMVDFSLYHRPEGDESLADI